MAQVTPRTTLPADSDTTGAVQLTGNSLRCSVRATALTTLALIRMDPSGKWFRITDSTGAPMQFTAQPGGNAGNLDVSFSLKADAANEYYNLIGDSTFAGYAELDSLSSPPGPGTSVPSSRVLSTPAGLLIAGAASADLSADRAFTFDPTIWTPSASAIALAANISVTAATGTGGIDYHLGTGDWKMPQGAGSWAGASGKALSFVSTAAAMTLTAGGVLTMTGTSISLGDGTVTQATSVTTGVTLNASSGVITTFTQSAAAGATSTFTVTNSCCLATSVPLLTILNYAGTYGTNGLPQVTVSAVSAGSFAITIVNCAPTNALSGALKIGFAVV
jgi:hypothetical protein